MFRIDSKYDGIELLLDLHRETAEIGGGWWVTFRVNRVEPSPERPHGLQYSLTLHSPTGVRTVGYDNAHKVRGTKKSNKGGEQYDHRHFRDKIHTYEFISPVQLLEDFWADVEIILKEEGVQ